MSRRRTAFLRIVCGLGAAALSVALWRAGDHPGAPRATVAAAHGDMPGDLRAAVVSQATSSVGPTSAVPPGPPGGVVSPAGAAAVASDSTQGSPDITLADVLAEAGDISIPANRERAVARMREIEQARHAQAAELARKRGLPLRVERPGGVVQELVAFERGQPVYFTTHNVNAAISTGAKALQASPYGLSGAGLTVGLWDGGSARVTHQEFAAISGSRVVSKDGAVSIDHATHVAGTIGAAGVVASAKGMAPAVLVDSYDWTNDKTEMTARAATAPNQAGMLYMSNHSYGYVAGWNYVGGGSPYRMWEWYGDGTVSTSTEYDFGRYNTYSRDSDALAAGAPYYLMFRSAGNDRLDNPSAGNAVALAPGGGTVVAYDSTIHPKGDGVYLGGGYGTVSFDALAKNVITIGSVSDAVTNGARDVSKAAVSSFSAWGPTDDGRIKPDVVANGDGLYSSLNGGDASYGTYSGTSMATPNALGTAALLFEDYARLFPGGAMRASMLKGLLIHTADDLGASGPDYQTGWGLINGTAASDLLRDHAANPLKKRLAEDVINATRTTVNVDFVWDGVTPIRATLCWTDPAGAATTTNDLRTRRLVNDLDLKIVAPTGAEFLPYVMPFVGDWQAASLSLPATTGRNSTDNVEQVRVAAPPTAGVYRVVVSLAGMLTGTEQRYSLLLTGAANQAPPPPTLAISAITPAAALPTSVNVVVSGVGIQSGAALRLKRSGSADIVAANVQIGTDTLSARLDLAGAVAGSWDVVVANPGGETSTLVGAFTVLSAIWSESFDGAVSGWSSVATTGTNAWTLSPAQSNTPAYSYFAPGPATKSTANLVSPVVPIPAGATNLQLKFWHRFDFSSGDAGKLELSVDAGATWFDVTATGSGASFAANGYTGNISATGRPQDRNEFAGQSAWVGSSGGFVEVVVNLTDTAKFAGKSFRARWRAATDGGTVSAGWYVDTVSLAGGGNLSNAAPVILSGPLSSSTETVTDPDGTVFTVVRGRDTALSVAASDDGGEAALVYSWTASSSGLPAVSFSANASNAAKSTVAAFEAAGDYLVTAVVQDASGLTASKSIPLRVVAVADSLLVSPALVVVTVGGQAQFAATLLDQFGASVSPQPASFSWTTTGGGSIGASGLFSATTAGGPYTISASTGGFSAIASVTVNRAEAAISLSGLVQTYDGKAKPVAVTTTPAGLACTVTYAGSSVAPSAVGSYAVAASVADPNYQGAASGTLLIRTGFAAWSELAGLSGENAGMTADPDGDGLSNLLEYATGTDPLAPNVSAVSVVVENGRLKLSFPRRADPLLVYTVECSGDLTSAWQTLAVSGNPSTGADNIAGTASFADTFSLDAATRRFLRLRVSY